MEKNKILKTGFGALAQSVEHLTFNQVVGGSNPPCFSFENAGMPYLCGFWRFFVCLSFDNLFVFLLIFRKHVVKSIQATDQFLCGLCLLKKRKLVYN